jgi:hypothetical protein
MISLVEYKGTDNFTRVLNRPADSEAISECKYIISTRSGERKLSKKGTDNFTGVLNRPTSSEAISEVSLRLSYLSTTLL